MSRLDLCQVIKQDRLRDPFSPLAMHKLINAAEDLFRSVSASDILPEDLFHEIHYYARIRAGNPSYSAGRSYVAYAYHLLTARDHICKLMEDYVESTDRVRSERVVRYLRKYQNLAETCGSYAMLPEKEVSEKFLYVLNSENARVALELEARKYSDQLELLKAHGRYLAHNGNSVDFARWLRLQKIQDAIDFYQSHGLLGDGAPSFEALWELNNSLADFTRNRIT